jgi:hypothetical protein
MRIIKQSFVQSNFKKTWHFGKCNYKGLANNSKHNNTNTINSDVTLQPAPQQITKSQSLLTISGTAAI